MCCSAHLVYFCSESFSSYVFCRNKTKAVFHGIASPGWLYARKLPCKRTTHLPNVMSHGNRVAPTTAVKM